MDEIAQGTGTPEPAPGTPSPPSAAAPAPGTPVPAPPTPAPAPGAAIPAPGAPAPGTRPDWLESTKHTRRRLPRVALPSGSAKKRNPWLVGAIVWGGIAVLVGAVVLGVHAWQERDRVVMPATLAGSAPATDPALVAQAQAWRDAMHVDPKAEGTRYEVQAFGDPSSWAIAMIVPMGLVWVPSDAAVLADANPQLLFGEPQAFGDVTCLTGDSGSGDVESWCFRSGDDVSVLVVSGPTGDTARTVLMVREAYAAQR